MRVTSSSGFSFRHAFYTVPSRLIGHRLHLRIHDDRIEAYLGAAHMLTLPRGRAPSKTGARATTTHIVDYRHVIGSLRAKPGALAGLTYRDALWPRTAYRRAWEALIAVRPRAGRTMVGLLALAHDRCRGRSRRCARCDAGELPDSRLRSASPPTRRRRSVICLPGLHPLLAASAIGMAARHRRAACRCSLRLAFADRRQALADIGEPPRKKAGRRRARWHSPRARARRTHQHPAVRPARRRQDPSQRSPRPRAGRSRPPRAVHPHH